MSTKNLATIAAVLGRAALHRRRSQVVFGNRRGNVIIGPAGVIDGDTVVIVICTPPRSAASASLSFQATPLARYHMLSGQHFT